ncbi:MAG: DNA-directed RNA polymerase subunit omega [Pyrinomonadaceae bacterium]
MRNKQLTASTEKLNGNGLSGAASEGTWPGIDSRFRLIILAGLRTKQLLHGSKPRIEVDKKRRRNTSIALEEVKRGLVPFTRVKDEAHDHVELELNYGSRVASTQKVKRQTSRP